MVQIFVELTEWQKLTRFGFHSWTSSFSQNFSAISLLPVPWSQPCLHLRLTWELLKRMDVQADLPPTPIKLQYLLKRPGMKYYKTFDVWSVLRMTLAKRSSSPFSRSLMPCASTPFYVKVLPTRTPFLLLFSCFHHIHLSKSGSDAISFTNLFLNAVWSESHSVVSDSLQPHGLYSAWNSPGQNISG